MWTALQKEKNIQNWLSFIGFIFLVDYPNIIWGFKFWVYNFSDNFIEIFWIVLNFPLFVLESLKIGFENGLEWKAFDQRIKIAKKSKVNFHSFEN